MKPEKTVFLIVWEAKYGSIMLVCVGLASKMIINMEIVFLSVVKWRFESMVIASVFPTIRE